MLVKKAFKAELDVTKAQEQLLRKHVGAKRFVYNWMLAECIFAHENGLKKPSSYDLVKKFRAEIKPTLDWYSEISARTEESASRSLDAAYSGFFRRIKQGNKGKKAGFPKFKKKRDGCGSFSTYGIIKATESSVTIQKIGMLKLKENRYIPIDSRITSATISTRGGRWFISCLCEVEVEHTDGKDGTVGIDLGVKHAITLSDGTTIDSPKPLARYTRKIRKLQKSVSRKEKGSNRRYEVTKRLNKLHYRISNIRANFIHNLTTPLAKTKQVIVIEDLNVRGMMANHSIARAISDIGFYEIRRQLEYKCKWYGSELIVADRWYPSSKLCSVCGFKNDNLTLADRDWVCTQCGTHLDRDVNAARNLAALAGKMPDSLNGRGDGSSVDGNNATAQPVCEASIYTHMGHDDYAQVRHAP